MTNIIKNYFTIILFLTVKFTDTFVVDYTTHCNDHETRVIDEGYGTDKFEERRDDGQLSFAEFPYLVGVGVGDKKDGWCSGVLLSPYWVLSVVYCTRLVKRYADEQNIRVQVFTGGQKFYQKRNVVQIIEPKELLRNSSTNILYSVLRVDPAFEYNSGVFSAQFESYKSYFTNRSCITVGFGESLELNPLRRVRFKNVSAGTGDNKENCGYMSDKNKTNLVCITRGVQPKLTDFGSPLICDKEVVGLLAQFSRNAYNLEPIGKGQNIFRDLKYGVVYPQLYVYRLWIYINTGVDIAIQPSWHCSTTVTGSALDVADRFHMKYLRLKRIKRNDHRKFDVLKSTTKVSVKLCNLKTCKDHTTTPKAMNSPATCKHFVSGYKNSSKILPPQCTTSMKSCKISKLCSVAKTIPSHVASCTNFSHNHFVNGTTKICSGKAHGPSNKTCTTKDNRPTTIPYKSTTIPYRPTTYPRRSTSKPYQHTTGPYRPTTYPPRPTNYPSRPTIYPSRPTTYPSRPTTYPSRPTTYPSRRTTKPHKSSLSFATYSVTEAETTEAVTTESFTTEAVTTESGSNALTTKAVTTEEVTTEVVTTEAVTTEAVTTEAVTTEAVTTEAVTTEAVTTEALTTEAVTTEALTTEAVTTKSETSEHVTTEAVTTKAVTTEAITTEAVTTEAVTTEAVTTAAETTEAETTEAETTEAETTEAETTEAETTEAETTEAGKPSTYSTTTVTKRIVRSSRAAIIDNIGSSAFIEYTAGEGGNGDSGSVQHSVFCHSFVMFCLTILTIILL